MSAGTRNARPWLAVSLLLACATAAALPTAEPVPLDATQLAQLDVATRKPTPVNEVPRGDAPARVSVPPAAERVVTAGGEGLITRVLAVEGHSVKPGQTLAEIESPALLHLQREYLDALSAFRLAQSAYRRDQELFADGIIAHRRLQETEQAFQERRTARAAARQLLLAAGMSDTDVEQLEHSRKLRRALPVRSPIAGVVLRQLAVAGSRVSAMEPLFRIADLSTLWLTLQLPAEQAAAVTPGDSVRIEHCGARAEVSTVGAAVDPQSQTVLVRAVLHQPCPSLRLGQLVRARVFIKVSAPVLVVPVAAVVHSKGQAYVFVRRNGKFEVQPVTVAAQADDSAWISDGLSADDEVAVSRIAALKAAWLGMGGE